MFFGDWLYKEYKLSRKGCKSFVPLVAFSALPTASDVVETVTSETETWLKFRDETETETLS